MTVDFVVSSLFVTPYLLSEEFHFFYSISYILYFIFKSE